MYKCPNCGSTNTIIAGVGAETGAILPVMSCPACGLHGNEMTFAINTQEAKTYKPFDREAALAGDLVMLRNGKTAKVGAYNPDADTYFKLIGWFDASTLQSWDDSGKFGNYEDGRDIVGMAPKKVTRKGWINVYPHRAIDGLHPTKATADQCVAKGRIACIEITYEFEG